jgi:hypothetical protein
VKGAEQKVAYERKGLASPTDEYDHKLLGAESPSASALGNLSSQEQSTHDQHRVGAPPSFEISCKQDFPEHRQSPFSGFFSRAAICSGVNRVRL